MPLEVQSKSVAPNGDATFQFSGSVYMCAAGISSFEFSFPDDSDNQLSRFSVNLDVNVSSNSVNVSVTSMFKDDSGHSFGSASNVNVCVVAYVGSEPNDLILFGPSGEIVSGQTSTPIALPSSSCPINEAALSGFSLCYAQGGHNVLGLNASVGASQSGREGFITAMAGMYDSTGHNAVNPSSRGLLIASDATNAPANPGMILRQCTAQADFPQRIDMGQPVGQAVCVVTGFRVKYPNTDDHYVQGVSAGAFDYSLEGNEVVIGSVLARIWDRTGHNQDDAESSCSVLIIGVPGS